MAAEKWRPGQTTAKGKDDLPKRQTDLNHTTIEQWIDEYGTDKDKAWFVQAAEEYQKEVVFYKWDEKELRKAFLIHLGVIKAEEPVESKEKATLKPSERLAAKYNIKK